MSYATAPLGTTANTVRVDLDNQFASFGPDADNLHCWICTSAEAMNQGAWLITGTHRDGRLDWADGDRYIDVVPSYMTDTRVKTIVCTTCAKGQPGARKMKITAKA
jgi:pectate lyase